MKQSLSLVFKTLVSLCYKEVKTMYIKYFRKRDIHVRNTTILRRNQKDPCGKFKICGKFR